MDLKDQMMVNFKRLVELPFSHLVNAHGSLLRDNARTEAVAAVQRNDVLAVSDGRASCDTVITRLCGGACTRA